MNYEFPKVDSGTWKTPPGIDWGCEGFDDLVENLANTFEISSVRRNRLKKDPNFYRLLIEIKAPAKLVRAFHSSNFGYRAQYYIGKAEGEAANKYLIDRLNPLLMQKIKRMEKSTCEPTWAAQSLYSPNTKIWIHQGLWLRMKERKIRNLYIERWISHIKDKDQKIAKKALWSMLIPDEEKLEIKGGFVSLDGVHGPDLKPERSEQINEYGFT